MTTVQELIDQLQALPDFQKRYRIGLEIDGAEEFRFEIVPRGGTIMIVGSETKIDRGEDEIEAARNDASDAENQVEDLEDQIKKLEEEIENLKEIVSGRNEKTT